MKVYQIPKEPLPEMEIEVINSLDHGTYAICIEGNIEDRFEKIKKIRTQLDKFEKILWKERDKLAEQALKEPLIKEIERLKRKYEPEEKK